MIRRFTRTVTLFLLLLLITTRANALSLISNGSMDQGTTQPANWKFINYRKGTCELQRDTADFHTGPASLLIQTQGVASSLAMQALNEPLPTTAIHFAGATKVEGTFTQAQVVVQVFDTKWKQIGWIVLVDAKNATDWLSFSKEITLPAGAAHACVGLSFNGQGKAWLDDMQADTNTLEVPPVSSVTELPVKIAANDPLLRLVGRWDMTNPKAPRCAWPACYVTVRFTGTAINARLTGSAHWQVIVDDNTQHVLIPQSGQTRYNLASGLSNGEHTVVLFKRTEAFFGPITFNGLELSAGGKLLQVPEKQHKILFIGDSITCGYGNEAANQNEHFSIDTENAYLSYGAMTARRLDADYQSICWSGMCMWPQNTIPEIYDRILPQDASSQWDASRYHPDVIVINLGTNDFAKGNPDEEGWIGGYITFIRHLRQLHPNAVIFTTLGPLLSDKWSKSGNALSTARSYLQRIVKQCNNAGDAKVYFVEFPQQTGAYGFGADWHPSIGQHKVMADVLVKAIKDQLGW